MTKINREYIYKAINATIILFKEIFNVRKESNVPNTVSVQLST